MLEIDRLVAGLGAAPVLREVSLALAHGERAALLGASGSGKSTLLRCIAGLASPRAGTIRVGGQIVADRDHDLAPARRGVAMVFQSYALWPHLTARQHVRIVARDPATADGWLARTHIAALHDRLPGQLSGGEQARLALARAFASGAKLLLLDEPLRNLDPPLAAELRAEIVTWIAEAGQTALLVTHDPAEAAELTTIAHVLDGGRIAASGAIDELIAVPPNDAVARLLGRRPVRTAEVAR